MSIYALWCAYAGTLAFCSILKRSSFIMNKRVCKDDKIKLIMECWQSGLSDY